MSPSRKASNALLRQWAAEVTGHVLSIGSGTDEDKQGGHYRDYFSKAESYTTSEPGPSPHCDRVLDVRELEIDGQSVDAILCFGVLEHVDYVQEATDSCYRALKHGGLFLAGFPFNQPQHRAPQDFWRFTEFGIRFLLRRLFDIEELHAIGDPAYPTTYLVKARKV